MFGDIKSIEMQTTPKPESYITFQHDLYTIPIISRNENRYKYDVQSADKWNQLLQQKESNSEAEFYTTPISMLNEDCFAEIFKYLSTKSQKRLRIVCKSMNDLVLKRGFKHITSLKYDWQMTLDQLQNKLKCVGKHITHLQFTGHSDESYEILARHVGKNIRFADFRVGFLIEFFNQPVIQILENLTSLQIVFTLRKFSFDFDFLQNFLPNLSILKLIFREHVHFVGSISSWPTLQFLSLDDPGPSINSEILSGFLKANAQITTLKIKSFCSMQSIVKSVSEYLPNLQRFSIQSKDQFDPIPVEAMVLQPLTILKTLTQLSIKNWEAENFNETLIILGKCLSLKTLKYLSFVKHYVENNTQIQQSFEKLAVHLLHLEKIYLNEIRFERCPFSFLNFISHAEHLKEIHLDFWSLIMTPELALQIVEILKTTRSPESNALPLKIFIARDHFHPNIYRENFDLIQKLDINDYLRISEIYNFVYFP